MSQKCSECGRETQFGEPLKHYPSCDHWLQPGEWQGGIHREYPGSQLNQKANSRDQEFPTRRFYVGIAECGCVQAAMVDDQDTTAECIADFARRQAKLKRRMEHRTCEPGSLWTVAPGCNVHRPEVQP